MIKYHNLIYSVILLSLAIIIITIIVNISNFMESIAINGEQSQDTSGIESYRSQINYDNNLTNEVNDSTNNHYETIEETIYRIKRDVKVTGTIIGKPGEESALFNIEGMADRSFQINTQLMDGFIIVDINEKKVQLKNQIGNETFFLYVNQ